MKYRCHTPHATAVGCVFGAALLVGGLLGSLPARADIDVRIDIGNAPPPPRFVINARPHERYFPEQRIYVVDDPRVGDYDVFRYGGYYWVFSDGYWYRCSRWQGPFRVVEPRYVPAGFYRLPPAHWKHHPNGPPGQMRRGGMPPGHMQGGGNPPDHMQQGGARGGDRSPAHMQQGKGGPPGQAKKDHVPPGQAKKGEKDKGGDKGRK